jgi:hypothetical protein
LFETEGHAIEPNVNGCRSVIPKVMFKLDDGHGKKKSPVVLIGYRGEEPVYRVTNTLGLGK